MDLQRICLKCYRYFLNKEIKNRCENEVKQVIIEELEKRNKISEENIKLLRSIEEGKEEIIKLKANYKTLHAKLFCEKADLKNGGNFQNKVSDRVVMSELLKKFKMQELDILKVKNEVENLKSRNNTLEMHGTCLQCSIF